MRVAWSRGLGPQSSELADQVSTRTAAGRRISTDAGCAWKERGTIDVEKTTQSWCNSHLPILRLLLLIPFPVYLSLSESIQQCLSSHSRSMRDAGRVLPAALCRAAVLLHFSKIRKCKTLQLQLLRGDTRPGTGENVERVGSRHTFCFWPYRGVG